MTIAAPLVLRTGDEQRLRVLVRSQTVTAGGSTAGPDRAAGRRGGAERGDRPARRSVPANGDRLAAALRRGRDRGSGRSGPAGPAHADRRGRCGGRDLDQAAAGTGGDALVGPAAGRPARDLVRVGGPDLAKMAPAAVAGRDVQILHRP